MKLWFDHGLGDCVHFAIVAEVCRRRGIEIAVHFEENKRAVWEAAGLRWVPVEGAEYVPWVYSDDFNRPNSACDWSGSKIAANLAVPPLDVLGLSEQVWSEICCTRVDLYKLITNDHRRKVASLFDHLPEPIVLVHTHGTNFAESKNLNAALVRDMYGRIVEELDASIILLDWDNRVPLIHHGRIRHLKQEFGHADLYELAAIMERSALLVGVDSGPYHLSAMTSLPALGVFHHHYPSCVTLPRPQSANLTRSSEAYRAVNITRRDRWNILEYEGEQPEAEEIVLHMRRFLDGPRYLRSSDRIGRDVALQQLVRDFSRSSTGLSEIANRDVTLDCALRRLSRLPVPPKIVETGCVRAVEDWSAGYSTYLFGQYLASLGEGKLISIDVSPHSLALARRVTAAYDGFVEFVEGDSVRNLPAACDGVDLLYLDSLDTESDHAGRHCLSEVEAAEKLLRRGALILIDDTIWDSGWAGKGAAAVPYLCSRGWKIVACGYQVLLCRD